MNKRSLFFILFCLVIRPSYGQNCDCKSNLSFVINKIQSNYSGYRDKVNAASKSGLNVLTDSLYEAASKIGEEAFDSCGAIIQRYIDFFKDGHLYLVNNHEFSINEDSVRQVFNNWPRVDYTEVAFKQYLSHEKEKHPLEGVWELDNHSYKVGIIYADSIYNAFVLRADSVYWVPGQIKFKVYQRDTAFGTIYFKKDHQADTVSLYVLNKKTSKIITGDWGTWYKINLSTGQPFVPFIPLSSGAISFSRLSSLTNLITIRSFGSPYIHEIDSVINAHDSSIRSTDNLIIDLRNNGGGADEAYKALKKYLYTQPYSIIGTDLYCTQDNIDSRRRDALDQDFSEATRAQFKEMADSMSKHKGSYWSPFPPYIKIKRDTVLPFPKRIVVLVNDRCASTTEQFLLDPVKNSKKAVIMGTHSAGVLDYANLNELPLPCEGYEIDYPTSRSKRIDMGKGIDNKGILPDIELDDSVKNWVGYAQRYLEAQ